MFEETVLPLALAEKMGRIRGKTRIQKLLFITRDRCKSRGITFPELNYQPYLYGPFSSKLAGAVDTLVSSQYVSQHTEPTPSGNTVNIYAPTQEGRDFLARAQAAGLIDKGLVAVIGEVAKEYGDWPLADLIDYAKSLDYT
jgi:uncharacterized protein YwgA